MFQVCNFPAQVPLQLNIPETPKTIAEPSHIPEYLPLLKQQTPPPEEGIGSLKFLLSLLSK